MSDEYYKLGAEAGCYCNYMWREALALKLACIKRMELMINE